MTEIDRYKLPGTFRFPSEKDFATYTSSALNDLGFDSEFVRTQLHVPMQTAANALIVGVEAAAQRPISQLTRALEGTLGVSAPEVAKLAGAVTSLIFNLVEGRVAVAVGAAVELTQMAFSMVTKAIGTTLAQAMADIIPIVGAMISAVIEVVSIFDSGWTDEQRAAAVAEGIRIFEGWSKENCPKIAAGFNPTGTSASGVSPADIFRASYIAAQLGHPPPPTVASMYVLLCGGETQGVGFTRAGHDRWLNKARKELGPQIGIDPWTQRKMWSLIKAIMFSVKNPEVTAELTVHGDNGRSAFALLQDITRKQYIAGRWTKQSARSLSRVLGELYPRSQGVDCGPACSGVIRGDCDDYFYLEMALENAQRAWQAVLEESFCQPGSAAAGEPCRWRALPTTRQAAALKRIPKKAVLLIGKAQMGSLLTTAARSEETQGETALEQAAAAEAAAAEQAAVERAANKKKALIVTVGVVAAFGVFVGARRLARS